MLALRTLIGTWLDLAPKASITYIMDCPIFDRDTMARNWSYPFKLQRTPTNMRELRMAGRIDAANMKGSIPVVLYIEGIAFEQGQLKILGGNQNEISVAFQNLAINTAEKLEGTQLRDLVATQTFAEQFCGTFLMFGPNPLDPEAIVALRINGVTYQSNYYDFQNFIDQINGHYPGLVELFSNDVSRGYELQFNCIEGFSQLEMVTQPEDLDYENLNIVRLFPTFPDYTPRAEVIRQAYRDADLLAGENTYRFPTVIFQNLYGEFNQDDDDQLRNLLYRSIVNRYVPENDQYAYGKEDLLEAGWRDTLLPLPRVASVLQIIAEENLLSLRGTYEQDEELAELLLWNVEPIDDLALYNRPDIVDLDLNLFNLGVLENTFPLASWNLFDYVPDMNALELLRNLNNTFCQYFEVEPGVLRIKSIKNLLRAAPEDITDKIEPNYSVSYDRQNGYSLDYDRQDSELSFPGQLERVPGGQDATEYTVPAFSLYEQVTNTAVGFFRLPLWKREGTSRYYESEGDAGFHLLFWRGLQPNLAGDPYPYASHSRQNAVGDTVGNYSLNWSGEGGLFDAWWKELITLLQHGRTDKRLVRLTVADLLQIRKWERIRKAYRTEDGTAVGVIRKVRVKISTEGIGLSEVTFQLEPS